MECKACGVASENTVFSSLLERLARISGEEPRPFKQLEVVLLAPSYTPGTRGAEIRLVRQIPINVAADGKGEKAVSTWTVSSHRSGVTLCAFRTIASSKSENNGPCGIVSGDVVIYGVAGATRGDAYARQGCE